ncbi:MAG: di-trans,poly-cis-decaprenylcistransferase [Candidatus Caenarcaniphilales bacterium]|nr:di-trans,poly-cis-decaprenylcistransferase [Candidatus Caenarcaniphilales bacterium]
MDGNRRWAKAQGKASPDGHKAGVLALRKLIKASIERGIDFLTVYAFSSENWKRSKTELDFLFTLLKESAQKELNNLKDQGVRVKFIGDLSVFKNTKMGEALEQLELETEMNTKLNLNVALNYGSFAELKHSAEAILNDLDLDQIINLNEDVFSQYLYTSESPQIDLVIRTGGKQRLSNFMLWQASQAQLYFTDMYWPDFNEEIFDQALSTSGLKEVCIR